MDTDSMDSLTIYIGSYMEFGSRRTFFFGMSFFRDLQDAETPSIPILHNFILLPKNAALCVFFFVFLACRNTFGEVRVLSTVTGGLAVCND